VTLHINSAAILAELATKSTAKEFLKLSEQVVTRLATENRIVGTLRVTGRLVEAPAAGEAIIIGDLHGDFKSLVHILDESNFLQHMKNRKDVLLIFLGDYGDRGIKSPEVYYIVLKLKTLFPENVILMRGNHEGPPDLLAYPHDLPAHLENKFGIKSSEAYSKLRELFNHLYTGVIIKDRYILFHGGVPSLATTIDDIAFAHIKHPRSPHLEEILWNDPWNKTKGTIASPRGAGRLFGEDVTNKFLRLLNVKVLIRGHQSCPEGYKTDHNGKVLTLFSRKGAPYTNIQGAYLYIDRSTKVDKPQQLLSSIRKF
jgi:diadenosine tetraphosphatase ApaH/serine/threonine PP2A family protein phosphatase